MNLRTPFLAIALIVTAFFLTACGGGPVLIQAPPIKVSVTGNLITSHRSQSHDFPHNSVGESLWGYRPHCRIMNSRKTHVRINGQMVKDVFKVTEKCLRFTRQLECTAVRTVISKDEMGREPLLIVSDDENCRPKRRR